MPFLPLERPALGIALLKASLRNAGIECDCRYLQFAFADTSGTAAYRSIVDETPTHDLVGEWVFTRAESGERLKITLKGNLAGMLAAARNSKRSPETGDLMVQIQLVAGARNQRYLQLSSGAA